MGAGDSDEARERGQRGGTERGQRLCVYGGGGAERTEEREGREEDREGREEGGMGECCLSRHPITIGLACAYRYYSLSVSVCLSVSVPPPPSLSLSQYSYSVLQFVSLVVLAATISAEEQERIQ